MNTLESSAAENYLDSVWRPDLGLPTAPAHPDYFASNLDLYVKTHLEMNQPERAMTEYRQWKASRFPDTGFTAHYMLREHLYGTNKFNAWHQHVIELPNGERVTPLAAPPNWAIAAEMIADDMDDEAAMSWVSEEFDDLCASSLALYRERDVSSIAGLVCQFHIDELTFRGGTLADYATSQPVRRPTDPETGPQARVTERIKQSKKSMLASVSDPSERARLDRGLPSKGFKPVIDIGINALMVANNDALKRMAERYSQTIPAELLDHMRATNSALPELVGTKSGLPESQPASLWKKESGELGLRSTLKVSIESLLAVGRAPNQLGHVASRVAQLIEAMSYRGNYLFPTYYESSLDELKILNKPDKGAISPVHNLELARSLYLNNYDQSIIAAADMLVESTVELIDGAGGFPRSFNPHTGQANVGGNAITRRVRSRQEFWTPTAASIVVSAGLAKSA